MNKLQLIFWVITGLFILAGCGKPTTPESIGDNSGQDEDLTGGYKIVKIFETPGYAQDVVKKDNLLYMAQGEGGLLIVDVSDPENPETVSVTTENVRGYSDKITMRDSVVYLAAGSFGVSVINVLDPVEPVTTVWNLNMKPASNIHLMGNYMFTAISEQGVKIASVDNPTQPEVRGGFNTPGYAMDIANTSDSAYLLVATGEMGLSMFDISDFQNGYGVYRNAGWCDTPGYSENLVIDDDRKLAFMACGTAGLQILRYSNETDSTFAIEIIGSFDAAGYAKELELKDNLVYMTTELSGLQVFDVTDVTDPVLIGMVETDFALGLTVDDHYVYIADEDMGLVIIAIP